MKDCLYLFFQVQLKSENFESKILLFCSDVDEIAFIFCIRTILQKRSKILTVCDKKVLKYL